MTRILVLAFLLFPAIGFSNTSPDKARAVDFEGNIISAGSGFTVFKHDSKGKLLWTYAHIGSAHRSDQVNALILDSLGNIYATGVEGNPTGTKKGETSLDYFTVKIDQNGNTLWERSFQPPVERASWDIAHAIALDANQNVYVTGEVAMMDPPSKSHSIDYGTLKYSPSGELLWFRNYNGPADFQDIATDLVVSPRGEIYVTGYSDGIETGQDLRTIKYDSNGTRLWVSENTGISGVVDPSSARIFLDPNGDAVVGGEANGTLNDRSILISKLNPLNGNEIKSELKSGSMQDFLSIASLNECNGTPPSYSLSQNYPNPFNPTTRIRYSIPRTGRVKLTVYDITGQEVAKPIDESQSAGNHEISFNGSNLASGVYFYSIEAEGFQDQKKMILTK